MMACMDFLYISFIGKSMKNTISHKSIVLETKKTSYVIVIVKLPQICVDIPIKYRERILY